jgi:probable HAF family extracellular repeat protein
LTLAMGVAAHAATYQVTDVAPMGFNNPSINRSGAIAGTIEINRVYHAFIFEQGGLRLLEAAGRYNRGRAINDRGDVAGECQGRQARRIKACVWTTVGLRKFKGLEGDTVSSSGINNARQVVGNMAMHAGGFHAYRNDHGVMTDLGTLGGPESEATAINKTGLVAGYSTVEYFSYRTHAFIHDGVTMKDLGTLAGYSSAAYALNDAGVVAGSSDVDKQVPHAVVFKDGQIIDLGTLGGDSSSARGINNAGDVVGWSRTRTDAESRAFVYQGDRMIRLDNRLDDVSGAGWTITDAFGINDAGQIVAVGRHNNALRIVLLSPMH